LEADDTEGDRDEPGMRDACSEENKVHIQTLLTSDVICLPFSLDIFLKIYYGRIVEKNNYKLTKNCQFKDSI